MEHLASSDALRSESAAITEAIFGAVGAVIESINCDSPIRVDLRHRSDRCVNCCVILPHTNLSLHSGMPVAASLAQISIVACIFFYARRLKSLLLRYVRFAELRQIRRRPNSTSVVPVRESTDDEGDGEDSSIVGANHPAQFPGLETLQFPLFPSFRLKWPPVKAFRKITRGRGEGAHCPLSGFSHFFRIPASRPRFEEVLCCHAD